MGFSRRPLIAASSFEHYSMLELGYVKPQILLLLACSSHACLWPRWLTLPSHASCWHAPKLWSSQVLHVRHHPSTVMSLGVAASADSALDGWRMSLVLGSAGVVLLGSEWLSR
jgi:hypothetical protein